MLRFLLKQNFKDWSYSQTQNLASPSFEYQKLCSLLQRARVFHVLCERHTHSHPQIRHQKRACYQSVRQEYFRRCKLTCNKTAQQNPPNLSGWKGCTWRMRDPR